MSEASDAWYGPGLRFACTRCGSCCTGEPGTVRFTPEEERAMARRLGLEEHVFRAMHVRRLRDGTPVLRERSNGDCTLFERGPDGKGGCRAYEARPRQCRTWPFWAEIVATPGDWQEAALSCPGMDRGPLHPAEEILRASLDDGTADEPA